MRTVTVSLVLALAASSNAQSSVAGLISRLRQAPTSDDRLALLDDSQLLFDFLNPPSGIVDGPGGRTVAASSANYLPVIGNNVAMTVGFLEPCGVNTPHTHPRASEITFSVNTTLQTGFLEEDSSRFVMYNLDAGSATVFPQGIVHFERNPSCKPAMFVSGFNHEDPGVQTQGQGYFGLPADILGAAFGGVGVQQIKELESMLPAEIALGAEECRRRCGFIPDDSAPDSQVTLGTGSSEKVANENILDSTDGGVTVAQTNENETMRTFHEFIEPVLFSLIGLNGAILAAMVIAIHALIKYQKRSAQHAEHRYFLPRTLAYSPGYGSDDGTYCDEPTPRTPNSTAKPALY